MTNATRPLPLALAAALSLAACGPRDDGAANRAAGEQVSNEEIPAGELGDLNATDGTGNFGDANAVAPLDEAITNNTESVGNGG